MKVITERKEKNDIKTLHPFVPLCVCIETDEDTQDSQAFETGTRLRPSSFKFLQTGGRHTPGFQTSSVSTLATCLCHYKGIVIRPH